MPIEAARAREIFLGAVEMDHPEAQAAYVEAECRSDAELRRRVQELLDAHFHTDDLLDHLPLPETDPSRLGPAPAAIGESEGGLIGPYTLIEAIGEGGMGVVYMAQQTHPVRRNVALKIIKPGMDTKQVIARFEAERQALALMEHTNIARVFDAGSTAEGRPYFVMELVRGIAITEYCDLARLDIPSRLRLFRTVCLAVEHAHQKGVIHRDLKPSNILVTVIDGAPIPKIIDFGVAKAMGDRLCDATIHTGFHQFVGTPLYMSPEQAALSGVDADTRCDIFSLGALLYEILTGTTPIERSVAQRSSHDDLRRMVRELDPDRPSVRVGTLSEATNTAAACRVLPRNLSRLLRGELDWVVMKALEKDRSRRYQSAGAFAADVQRFLDGHPLEAGPPSTVYRFQKFARRNQSLLTTAGFVTVALIFGIALSTWQAIRATRAERHAEASLTEANAHRMSAERHLRNSLIKQAEQAIELGHADRAREILDHPLFDGGGDRPQDFAWGYLRRLLPIERRIDVPEAYRGPFLVIPGGRGLAYTVGGDEVRIEDLGPTPRPPIRLAKHTMPVKLLKASADGSRLVSAANDSAERGIETRVWDTRTGQPVDRFSYPHPTLLDGIALAAFDQELLIKVFEEGSQTRRIFLHRLGSDASSFSAVPANPHIQAVPARDGSLIGDFEAARIIKKDPIDGKEAWRIETDARRSLQFALSPEGRSFIALIDGRKAIVVDTDNGALRHRITLGPDNARAHSVMVGPRAMRIVALDSNGALIWLARPTKSLRRIELRKPGRANERFLGALSPNAELLALTAHGQPGNQDPPRIYDVATGMLLATYAGQLDEIGQIAFDQDGQSLIFNQSNSIVRWFFDRSGANSQPPGHTNEAWAVAFSPDGKTLASGSDDARPGETLKLWNTATGKIQHARRPALGLISSLAFSPDGKTLAMASFNPEIRLSLLDVPTGKLSATFEGHTERVRAVAFSPDGKTLASAGSDKTVRLWNPETRLPIATLTGHTDTVRSVAFSPDGRTLATASNDKSVKLWNVRRRTTIRTIHGTMKAVAAVFSPDGLTLATASQDEGITLWDTGSGERKLAFQGNDPELLAMAFSPDGQMIATAGAGKVIRLWDTVTGERVLELKGHDAQINGLAFSPDGKTLASCSHDGAVRLWRTEDPRTAP